MFHHVFTIRAQTITASFLILGSSCTSPGDELEPVSPDVSLESAAPETSINEAAELEGMTIELSAADVPSDDSSLAACFWSGWQCGKTTCPDKYYVHAIDFNATPSEGCWGAGNDYDEPFRRIQCCESTVPSYGPCFWSNWQCGAMTCPNDSFLTGVDFNRNQSEGCWGAGNDYDEPFRRIECCDANLAPSDCYWTGWGCGQMKCANGYYAAGVDFNINQSEGCWGAGNDYDEPFRSVLCCSTQ